MGTRVTAPTPLYGAMKMNFVHRTLWMLSDASAWMPAWRSTSTRRCHVRRDRASELARHHAAELGHLPDDPRCSDLAAHLTDAAQHRP